VILVLGLGHRGACGLGQEVKTGILADWPVVNYKIQLLLPSSEYFKIHFSYLLTTDARSVRGANEILHGSTFGKLELSTPYSVFSRCIVGWLEC